jgi:arylsulfatase A-like enzyme
MKIKTIIILIIFILFFYTFAQVLAAVPERPNFLFILVDDLGWTDLSSFGSAFYETPNCDRIAAEGMRFTNAYAACPVCSPTRASIMIGQYPARLSTTDWFGAPQPDTVDKHWTRNKPLLPAPYDDRIPLEQVTIAEALKSTGYKTFFAGKWHLGPEGFWPENQGFDINIGGWTAGGPWGENKYFSPYGNPRLEDGPKGEHLPDRLASETITFIETNKEHPFLAYLSFYSVHTPLMTRSDLQQKYDQKRERLTLTEKWGEEGDRQVRLVQNNAVYAGMVEAMDQAVGKVLNKMDELGLSRNTVIIFMSDNGGLSTSEGHPTSNLPLRAGKGWLYEGGIRVPMMIKWPEQVAPGSVCSTPVISTDFYPTIFDMAQVKQKSEQHMDGVSLLPLLQEKGEWQQRPLFWHYPHYGNQGGSPGAAIRYNSWKLIEFFEDNHVELYTLQDDIGETKNLAVSMPDKVNQLQQMLHNWQKDVNARFPSANPNYRSN